MLVRSQELPLFSRLGPHPRSLIDDHTAAGELFEYWVHEASHVPTKHYHLHRWAMEGTRRWVQAKNLRERRPTFIDEVYERVASAGPVASGDLSERVGKKAAWWDWDDGKVALEYLFLIGRLAAVRRPNDFARIYDVTERVIPAEALARPTPGEADARKQLMVLAAKHHGVGTFEDLTDYHRQRNPPCRPLIAELVEDGRLFEVEVEGWSKPGYVVPEAVIPRRIDASALLSPFDPVVWNRDRAERLYGFRYRIEIYVPKPKRQYGYYVLPFLWGDQMAARVDLKADRLAGTLLVQGSFAELGVPIAEVAHDLAAELWSMARWLSLERVAVVPNGDLASALASAVSHYARR